MLRKGTEAPSVVIDQPVITPEQEQEKWLGEACLKVKERAISLRKAMETDAIYEVLRWASALLSELRTNLLSPQNYYEVYMKIFDIMLELEAYFLNEVTQGRKVAELYEVVQYAGNVVPRIYLLATIGSVFIKTKQAPAKDILKDLVEMCKGVQNPTRGLFLRNYLSQLTKNKLPDEYEEGNEYAGEGGTVEDSVAFILQNFREMTWLWVRMGVKSVGSNGAKREKERKDLRLLVGFNLVRISQLEGVTKKYYKVHVLPQILEIITAFEDVTAQQYLFECVIQVFPDEYHLATLDQLLGALSKLTGAVPLQPLISTLMDRLATFAVRIRDGDEAIKLRSSEAAVLRDMFQLFREKISSLAQENRLGHSAFVQVQITLLSLAMKVHPGEASRVDEVMLSVVEHFKKSTPEPEVVSLIRSLLEKVAESIPMIDDLLDLNHYKDLVDTLPFQPRRDVALAVMHGCIRGGKSIGTLDRVTRLLEIVSPLVYDVADRPPDAASIYTVSPDEEFEEEQHLICKLVHYIDNREDYALTFKLLSQYRKAIGRGGPERMRYTLIALTNAFLRFAIRVRKAESAGTETGVRVEKIFSYIHSSGSGKGLLEILAQDVPNTAMQLYLRAGSTADVCSLGEIAYELFGEAFLIYEEKCPDSKVQISSLETMVSCLCLARALSVEHFEILSMKVCQYSSKLMRKPDQCRAVTTCSHVFFSKLLPDEHRKKILECLQRGLKIVDNCPRNQQVPLFVELLNHYVYYYQNATPNVGAKYINTLLELIEANMDESAQANKKEGSDSEDDTPVVKKVSDKDASPSNGDMAPLKTYYANTKTYIQRKQASSSSSEAEKMRWNEIKVG